MGIFNFRKKKKIANEFHDNSELIGVYRIKGVDSVNLIEILFEEEINDFEPGDVTQ